MSQIELKVPFCCEGCQDNIREALIEMDGVDLVKLDPEPEKVTITGKVRPEDALKEAKKVVRRSEMWPKKDEGKKDDKKDDKKKNLEMIREIEESDGTLRRVVYRPPKLSRQIRRLADGKGDLDLSPFQLDILCEA